MLQGRIPAAVAVGVAAFIIGGPAAAAADDGCTEPEREPIDDETTHAVGPSDVRVSYDLDGTDGHVAVWSSSGWLEIGGDEDEFHAGGSTGHTTIAEPVGARLTSEPDACASGVGD